jgi:hypothetical protein
VGQRQLIDAGTKSSKIRLAKEKKFIRGFTTRPRHQIIDGSCSSSEAERLKLKQMINF